jgi:hypothetical protein
MRRVTSLLAVVLIGSALLATSASRPLAPSSLKGFRAVLFQGEPIDGAVRIGNIDAATELYGKVVNEMLGGEKTKEDFKAQGRPCIGIGFVRLNPRTSYLPTEAIHLGDAGLVYWFYQAVGDQAAVFPTGRLMSQQLADELATFGVPVKMNKPARRACEFALPGW